MTRAIVLNMLESGAYSLLGIVLALVSLASWVVDGLYGHMVSDYQSIIQGIDLVIFILFTVEFGLRLALGGISLGPVR